MKIKDDDNVSVFTPKQMANILHSAPPHPIPIPAIGHLPELPGTGHRGPGGRVVRLAVVYQVADAVRRFLEDRSGGEDNDTDLGIDERDGAGRGDESGKFPDEAEVFER